MYIIATFVTFLYIILFYCYKLYNMRLTKRGSIMLAKKREAPDYI